MPGGAEDLGRSVLRLVTDASGIRTGIATARAEALSSLNSVQSTLDRTGAAISKSGRAITAGVTLPVIAAGAAIVKVGTDFEATLNQIVGLTDVSREEIGGIKTEILKMGVEIGRTPQELAEGLYFLASAGFNTKESLQVLRVAATAAAAGLGTTQDVAKVLGLTLNAYGHENITAARAADILTAAVKDGTAEADAFAGVLGRVVPTAATLGVSFDQVAGALAGMTLTGLSADEAATSLNQVLVSLLKPTSEAEKTLRDLGFSAAGLREELKTKGLLAVLRDLETAFNGNDDAAAKVFGNVRALRGVLSLLAIDSKQLDKVFADTAAAQGDLAEGYKETEGSARQFARAQAAVEAELIDLSSDVLPVVLDMLQKILGVVHAGVQAFKGLPPEVRSMTVAGLALLAVLGPILIVAGALVSSGAGLLGVVKPLAARSSGSSSARSRPSRRSSSRRGSRRSSSSPWRSSGSRPRPARSSSSSARSGRRSSSGSGTPPRGPTPSSPTSAG
jgi:TP901 family phage tail tape measure protein